MMTKNRQNIISQVGRVYFKAGKVYWKANTVYLTVNGANAQSRPSGILFAQANGKLYFEFLKIFSVPENHLPLQGAKRFRSQRFLKCIMIILTIWQQKVKE